MNYLWKMLIAWGLPITGVFLYELYKIAKVGEKQKIHNMNHQELGVYIINIALVIAAFLLIIIGVFKNNKFTETYMRDGIYKQAIVEYNNFTGRYTPGYDYKLKLIDNGEERDVCSYSDSYYYKGKTIGVYYVPDQSRRVPYVMIEGDDNCFTGDCMIRWGFVAFGVALFVLGMRYDLFTVYW